MAKGLDISCFQHVTDHSKQLSFQAPGRNDAKTDRKLSNPASRFSMISSARSSGSGRLSRSVRLLSFSQNRSRLALSRASNSSRL